MKSKMVALTMLMLITIMLLFENSAYALSTRETIYVTIVVRDDISMNLEDEWLRQNLCEPEGEAFSELKESGILVDKLGKDDSTLWLFTKTE